MDQRVAVHAGPATELCRWALVGHTLCAVDADDVPAGQIAAAVQGLAVVTAVALLAQEGCAGLEQGRIGRAVGGVAVGAIVGYRAMLPQEWAAFFSMAGIAGLVDAVFYQQLRTGRAMGVMAIGAGHLASSNRVGRDAVCLSALSLVAGEADFRLRGLVQYLVVAAIVVGVATGTGHTLALLLAALPMAALAGLVAGNTSGVLDRRI